MCKLGWGGWPREDHVGSGNEVKGRMEEETARTEHLKGCLETQWSGNF